MKGQPHTYAIAKNLFGGQIDIVIALLPQMDLDDVVGKVETIYEYGLRLQKVFNFYDPTSELSRLNAERTATVSPQLRELIEMGISMSELTNGAYDITLGKYVRERKSNMPVSPQACSYKDVEIIGERIRLLHPDVQIDLGSIAKGYITDCMADAFAKQGLSGLIDARGDIITFGSYAEKLGIQDPRDSNNEIGDFILQESAVATSGDYNQYDTDYSKSHILHQGRYSSITVVTRRLTEADMLTTALFVSDASSREKILAAYPNAAVVCVGQDGTKELYNDRHHIFTLS